jgi:hypothetical protein
VDGLTIGSFTITKRMTNAAGFHGSRRPDTSPSLRDNWPPFGAASVAPRFFGAPLFVCAIDAGLGPGENEQDCATNGTPVRFMKQSLREEGHCMAEPDPKTTDLDTLAEKLAKLWFTINNPEADLDTPCVSPMIVDFIGPTRSHLLEGQLCPPRL